jgi:F0F1-type ATP synthase epsilon subunit
VLADAAEFGTEINADKARQRLAEATKAMEKPADDPAPALAEFARAQAAVDAASKR